MDIYEYTASQSTSCYTGTASTLQVSWVQHNRDRSFTTDTYSKHLRLTITTDTFSKQTNKNVLWSDCSTTEFHGPKFAAVDHKTLTQKGDVVVVVPYTLLLGRTCEGRAGKFVLWLAVEFDANLLQPRLLQHPRFPPVSDMHLR